MDNETIIVNKEFYESLLADSHLLDCLKAAGVDNWDWYEVAVEEYCKRYG